MANRDRTTNLVVRAQDQYSKVLNNLKKMQQEVVDGSAASMRKAAVETKAAMREMAVDLTSTRSGIKELTQEFNRLSRAEGDNRAEMAAVLMAKTKLRAAALELQTALGAVSARTHDINAAQKDGFKTFSTAATAMEREAAAALKLADARQKANDRLRGMINSRQNNPVQSNFASWSSGAESRVDAQREAEMTALIGRAYARRERDMANILRAQERLNTQVKSGFGDWSRYADTITRIAAVEERSAAVTARKAEIQARLNNQVKSGFAAWSRSTAALNGEAAAANATAAALNKVESASKRAATAQNQLAQSGGAAGRRGRGNSGGRKGEGQDVEMYGLKPYQMVNLGYQLNDVISGLAMGQAPLQILAQQAGQFAQIWPNVMVGLVRSLPAIAATAAAIAPFAAAIAELVGKRKALEEFDRQLRTMADGANYSAEKLVAITRSFEELAPMIERGFSPDQMKGFHSLAKTLSNANGKSIAENVDDLSRAFGGGVEGVRNLDRELNFLSASQLKQMRAMEDQGDTAGALKIAQDALASSYESFASKARGPWGRAAESLGGAWKNLIKWLSGTLAIRVVVGVFDQIGKTIEWLTGKVKALTDLLPNTESDPLGDLDARIQQQKDLIKHLESQGSGSMARLGEDGTDVLDTERATLALMVAEREKLVELQQAGVQLDGLQVEATENIRKLADDQVHALEEEARLAKMTERARYQELEVLKLRNEAMEKGLALSDAELARVREAAGLTYDALNTKSLSGNVIDKIVGVESGGNASAKNPSSSATGLGQFIESTWLRMFRQYFPQQAAGMGEKAILELRKDAQMSRTMVELYAMENKKNLEKFGVAVTDASVYLAHFLGPQGAVKLLKADPNTPVDQILGAGQISANKGILAGKTAGQVHSWAQQKMGISSEELAAGQRLAEIDKDRAKAAKDYTDGYQERIDQQRFELELAQKSAREAAIQKAVREEELVAIKAGTTLTAERRAEVEQLAAATFDNANAETRVNALMEKRSTLLESLKLAQDSGNEAAVQDILQQIGGTEEELNLAIDAAIRFYQALGGPEAEAAILRLQNMKAAVGDIVRDMETKYIPTAEEINNRLVDMGGNAFSAFAESIAQGESAWDAFKNTVVQGLGEMLIWLGKAIVQQALFNALTGGGANPGGGAGGWIAGMIAKVFHGGGIAGGRSKAGTRMVDPSIFAGAERYHTGGVPALGPNERPIIVNKDEEILTRDDPRHIMNAPGGKPNVTVKNVNAFNPVEVMEAALADEVGEQVFINWMTRRARAINGALTV